MKSVNEIKEMASEWHKGNISSNEAFLTVLDALIGITEYLEAQPERSDDTIRREGMIKALRWCDETTDHAYGGIAYAIARLENGGDL